MTKADIIKALEPFTDDIELIMRDGSRFFAIDHHAYGISWTGDGAIVLQRGAQLTWPCVTSGKGESQK